MAVAQVVPCAHSICLVRDLIKVRTNIVQKQYQTNRLTEDLNHALRRM